MEKQRTLVSLEQIETGSELKLTIQELLDKVKDIDPTAYRLIKDKIKNDDLDPDLYALILSKSSYDDTEIRNRVRILEELKANRSELLDYRRLDVDITEEDLEAELRDKINILYEKGYDDRWVHEAINRLDRVKFNRYEIENYRHKDIPIGLDDLDHQIHDLLYDIQTIVDEVNVISESAVTKDYLLENYRRKVIDINYDDLSTELQRRLDGYSQSSDIIERKFVVIDNLITTILDTLKEKANQTDVDLKASKIELELKADKTYVDETFRRKNDLIEIEDLSQDISDKINNISPEFNSETVLNAISDLSKNKADKSYLDNFLRRTDPICENDLDYRLLEKINRAIDKYDDTDVIAHIKNLQTQKVDIRDLKNYRHKLDAIEMTDLSDELKIILNSHMDNNAEHKSIIATLRYIQDNMLDDEFISNKYFSKTDIIPFDNLDPIVEEKYTELTNLINVQNTAIGNLHRIIDALHETINQQQDELNSKEERIRFNELEIERIKKKLGMI